MKLFKGIGDAVAWVSLDLFTSQSKPIVDGQLTHHILNKMHIKNKLILPIVLLTLSGCSISTNIKPVATKISDICIKNNPAVFMDGFLPELRSQIESHNIKTRVFDDVMSKDCPYQLEYTANWRWDFVMWLTYAELKVYENGNGWPIGEAVYNARSGGGRPDKFGPTAGKLRSLTDSLFAH